MPKLTKALTRNSEVIMWKLHRATLEVIYKEMGCVKGNIGKFKELLRSLKIGRDMIILPPYNVEGNMREAPVRSLFYCPLLTALFFARRLRILGARLGRESLTKNTAPCGIVVAAGKSLPLLAENAVTLR